MFSEDDGYHEYSENNRYTCQHCKDLYNKHGETHAQIEDYHKIIPIIKKKQRGGKSKKAYTSRKSKKAKKKLSSKKIKTKETK
jgi:hypothetical protein